MTGRSLSDLTRTVSGSDRDTMLEEEETACATLCASVPTPLIVLGAVLAWLLGGAGVYSWLNDWPFWQSYYYAVNVGWSIGFGALVEQNDASRLDSVLMNCLGAGAVGGGVSAARSCSSSPPMASSSSAPNVISWKIHARSSAAPSRSRSSIQSPSTTHSA